MLSDKSSPTSTLSSFYSALEGPLHRPAPCSSLFFLPCLFSFLRTLFVCLSLSNYRASMDQYSPQSPNGLYVEAILKSPIASPPRSPMVKPTRTVAIIKPHALERRFDIENRITAAGFEVSPPLRYSPHMRRVSSSHSL